MTSIRNRFLFIIFCALVGFHSSVFAKISFETNQVELVLAPTCNHVPIHAPYTLDDASFDESLIEVSSDSDWAVPSVNAEANRIEVAFNTKDLIASYTATILVDDGETATELFVHATVSPLNIFRLVDDPLRSVTYGIQRNDIHKGAIIAFDPVQESITSCVSVGESPTDMVINDNSSELLVINSVGKNIDVIDLNSFSVKETIPLPSYEAWGDPDETTANIDLGPSDIIYYSDGAWGPVLHVLKRSTGELLQSLLFDGSSPSNGTGFMDFAVTSDKTKMVAMPQYGWSAGAHSPTIGQFTINADGTVKFIKETTVASFDREPFEAPVLMRDDDQVAIMKTISTDPADTNNLDRVFPSTIWSMSPNGSVVATGDKLYDYNTGNELYTIPDERIRGSGYLYTKAQAFTSDFTRFVYFNASNRTLNVINLIDAIGLELLGRSLSPADGSVTTSPDTLTWAPLSGVDQYDVYLGADSASVLSADTESPLYLGRITGTSLSLLDALAIGTEYFWRIDPVTKLGPEAGAVYSFTVSEIGLDKNEIDVKTVAGHSDFQVDIQLSSQTAGVAWTATSDDSWVSFTQSTGVTPATLSVHLDSTSLASGFHNATINLQSSEGEMQVPVQLQVEPLNVTHIRSDRQSATVYAISEDTSNAISRAYLLEIDSQSESIQRVIPVGSSVTDFTIHYADDLIYVANWKSGNLIVIDKNTLERVKTIAFQPAGATGYSEGDVYRVAAGVSQRLVVEEEDQWIEISLFNSKTESTLNQAFVREGGGAFDPTGRYYYHGENNSSGASIIKFDTSGDVFTNLAEVRPEEISSYYGSRTVIVSEDGSRIFWSGVALDQDLNTIWGIDDMIYAASANGRYAFGETAIYDINLRRQVLTMPTSTTVSGYNSTSEKLILQLGEKIKFYDFTSPISLSAPVLSAGTPDNQYVELSWTDDSLESAFVVQQRVQGATVWDDIVTTPASTVNWTAGNLQEATTYEFRVRATAGDISSPWSNVVTVATPATPNEVPVAVEDVIPLPNLSSYGFVITGNDFDHDGSLDLESVVIVTSPQFGQLTVNTGGQLTYVPNNDFEGMDSFTYTIDDNESATSAPATVTLIYLPPPVLRVSNPSYNSVELDWTVNDSLVVYQIQQRKLGTGNWFDTQIPYFGETSWVVSGLQGGSTYEFRVNAIAYDIEYVTEWSNTVSATTLQQANAAPVAQDDLILLPYFSSYLFSVIANDYDSDGQINQASVTIVSQPKFGQVTVNVEGAVTYSPNSNFSQTDSFTYTIKDNNGATSSPAKVTVSYSAAPTLSISKITSDSITLGWTYPSADLGFEVQQRILNSSTWMDMQTTTANAGSWTAGNLLSGSTYEFRIRAITSESTSPWSNVAIATADIEPNTNTGGSKEGGSMDFMTMLIFAFMFLMYREKSKGRRI